MNNFLMAVLLLLIIVALVLIFSAQVGQIGGSIQTVRECVSFATDCANN